MSRASWLGLLAGIPPILMGLRILRFHGWPHFGAVNLVANGVVLMVLAGLAWPERSRWSWLLYAFMLYLVGSNDLAVQLEAGKPPAPLVPLLMGTVALILQAPSVWRNPKP